MAFRNAISSVAIIGPVVTTPAPDTGGGTTPDPGTGGSFGGGATGADLVVITASTGEA